MEVGAAMQAARFARAALGDRLVVLREARLRQIDPEAAPGLRREGGAVPGDPGWDRAVEQVDPHADPGEQVVDLADPQQMARDLIGQQWCREAEDAVHLLLLSSERPADRDPVDR